MHTQRYPIIDLHCDLLSYLSKHSSRNALDKASRCSLPQMRSGGVALQVVAIYVANEASAVNSFKQQVQSFFELPIKYPEYVQLAQNELLNIDLSAPLDQKIQLIPAFENATGIAHPSAGIKEVIQELTKIKASLGSVAYISLTWDGENRYGGGVGSNVGLKEDGKELLRWMNEHHIPVDLSHASDFLMDDLFNWIEKKNMQIPVLASHSNFRSVTYKERNLADDFAKEIIRRKGVIGLNFFSPFSGANSYRDLIAHIEHAIDLHAEKTLSLGADFFEDMDISYMMDKYQSDLSFYPELSDSSCYPCFIDMIFEKKELKKYIDNITHKNAFFFFERILKQQK